MVKEAFQTGLPKPSNYFVFNTRREIFRDARVREALSYLFDFEWVNRSYFFELYRRTAGYFDGSELSSHRRPADARERELLARFPDAVRPDVLEGTWSPPVSDGSGRDRTTLKRALDLFSSAGFELRGGALVDRRSGAPFTFEILVTERDEERLALIFSQSLKRAGIAARVRLVDAVQFEARRVNYDFEMIEHRWDQSLSPGNEQTFYWGSAAADQPGTRNYMGIKNPAVDAMIAALLNAQSRPDFAASVRALDRVLISGFYTIPLFHLPEQWVARWTPNRPSCDDLALRVSSRDLVARARAAMRPSPLGSPLYLPTTIARSKDALNRFDPWLAGHQRDRACPQAQPFCGARGRVDVQKSSGGRLSRAGARCRTSHLGGFRIRQQMLKVHN